ncbi:hypothetical protein [Treponema sp. R80B11-R83G3]
MNETIHRLRLILYLLLAFLAGCLCAGLFFNRQRFTNIGNLDKRVTALISGGIVWAVIR